MSEQVEFYYDYGSPAAYLAWARLPAICEEHGAQLIRKPILLGGLFKATGNQTPVNVKPKGEWMFDDLARHAAYFGVPFNKNPFFIINTLPLMRGAMWAQRNGQLEHYDQVMFEAIWVNAKDMNSPETKKRVDADTAEAAKLGVTGTPGFFINGKFTSGAKPFSEFKRIIDEQLKAKGAA